MNLLAWLLSVGAVAGLVFIAVLTVDGVRVLMERLRRERAARPLDLVVTARQEVAGHLVCLQLRRRWGRRLPAYMPGQYVVLSAPLGPGGREVRRAYSLAAWQAGRPKAYELGIKREPQGLMSSWVWDALRPGQRVRVLPPKGDFVLQPASGERVLIGAGIGITPMRAMLHAALSEPGRVLLFHAARHEDELLYREEFERLAARFPTFHYLPTVSRPGTDWPGARGRLDAGGIIEHLLHPAVAQFYLCASDAVMASLTAGFEAAGILPSAIHREAFGAALGAGGSGQNVDLPGGKRVVTAGEPSLLHALEAAGCAPPSECRAGSCGLCRMQLLGGEVRWGLAPGCELQQGEILPCICQAVSDLRLA